MKIEVDALKKIGMDKKCTKKKITLKNLKKFQSIDNYKAPIFL